MSEPVILQKILSELNKSASCIPEEQINNLSEVIQRANRIFVGGAGRSGFAARAFANRLMHLGLTVYFLGDTTTPAIRDGDLLIICSGSGETESMKLAATKAKSYGARIACVTIHKESSIGTMSDVSVIISGANSKSDAEGDKSIQPMGSEFEQLSWLVFDSIIMILMDRLHETPKEMYARHANLE